MREVTKPRGDDRVLGVAEEWDFDYPYEQVKMGYRIMKLTSRMPHPHEIGAYDPRWVSDLDLMEELYQWHKDAQATK